MNRNYHHGDLPSALRAATAELVAERGASGFSLREVARRAGVSHAAPAHHFGDSRGLLTSVATEGFTRLSDAFATALDGVHDPVDRLCALGKAYVRTALENPGHFGVMCNADLVDGGDEGLAVASLAAYEALQAAISDIRDAINPELDVATTVTMMWAMVHGLAVLAPSLDSTPAPVEPSFDAMDQLVERFTTQVVSGLAAR